MKNKSYFTLQQLCMMSFMAVMGMFIKPLISPVFNLLTDFIRIPGGSVTAGFSMIFLVFAAAVTGKYGTATLMGFVQAVISLNLGISSMAGMLVFITYTLPGMAIDAVLCTSILKKLPLKIRMAVAGGCGVLTSATISNILYLHLSAVPFLLFYTFGVLSGILGGTMAWFIMAKIPANIINKVK